MHGLHFSSQIKYNALLYIDTFLSRNLLFPYHKLELLGINCISVACKVIIKLFLRSSSKTFLFQQLEERLKLNISHINYLCADSYEEEEIYTMEIELLKSLKWKLVYHNLADLIKILVLSFVEEPSTSLILNIEEILDFCISRNKLRN